MTNDARIAPGISWTVECDGVRIIAAQGNGRPLNGLEGAAWDLISRGNSLERAIPKLAAIGKVSTEDACSTLDGWLREWQAQGWIARGPGHG